MVKYLAPDHHTTKDRGYIHNEANGDAPESEVIHIRCLKSLLKRSIIHSRNGPKKSSHMGRRINRHSDDSINLTSEPLSQIILPALRAEKNQSAPRERESICRLRSMEILTPNKHKESKRATRAELLKSASQQKDRNLLLRLSVTRGLLFDLSPTLFDSCLAYRNYLIPRSSFLLVVLS